MRENFLYIRDQSIVQLDLIENMNKILQAGILRKGALLACERNALRSSRRKELVLPLRHCDMSKLLWHIRPGTLSSVSPHLLDMSNWMLR